MPGLPRRFAFAMAAAVLMTASPLAAKTGNEPSEPPTPPAPVAAKRPAAAAPRPAPAVSEATALAERLRLVNGARSWGYQLHSLRIEDAAKAPFDMLVVDATTGLAADRPFRPDEVAKLKRKPDGSRRIVVSYLSVGEAEDYRPEYFTKEYMTEDAPDWLMQENKDWKGNRLIRFCSEGWQKTILGDDKGRSVYNSIEPSPLYRLMDLGFDGVYLDRVDVYEEITKECPDGERRMVEFVARLAAHARKRDPNFLVILQNAEDLLKHRKMIDAIDAVAKESLFHGWGGGDGSNRQSASDSESARWSIERLNLAKKAGRAIFVIDYTRNRTAAENSVRRIREQGFVPYVGPKELGTLWLPGVNF